MYCIVMDGIVNDPLVTKVVGTTTNGKTASATPVNSCWYLIFANLDMVDSWKTVEAQDANGNTLHSLTTWVP